MHTPAIVVADPSELAEAFAARVERAAAAAILARGRFAFTIPGGSAAEKLLPRLARARVEWPRTGVFYSDERFVPRSDPDSSASASMALLFQGLGSAGPRVHPMVDSAIDADATAARYAELLVRTLGEDPVMDLVLLGIGEDGHVASLFPERASLEVSDAHVIVERDSPKPPPTRLTLSLPLLARAREVVIAAFGAGKADVLHDVLHDPACTLPAARLLRRATDVTLLLDPAAAARL